jgi:hypothetical protein
MLCCEIEDDRDEGILWRMASGVSSGMEREGGEEEEEEEEEERGMKRRQRQRMPEGEE